MIRSRWVPSLVIVAALVVVGVVVASRPDGGVDSVRLPAIADLPVANGPVVEMPLVDSGTVAGHRWELRARGTTPEWAMLLDGHAMFTSGPVDDTATGSMGQGATNEVGASVTWRADEQNRTVAQTRVFRVDGYEVVPSVRRRDVGGSWVVLIWSTANPVTGVQMLDTDGRVLWSEAIPEDLPPAAGR